MKNTINQSHKCGIFKFQGFWGFGVLGFWGGGCGGRV